MNLRNTAFKAIMNGLYFSGAHRLFSFKTAGLGAIVMLHHVRDSESKDYSPNAHLTVAPQSLEELLQSLRRMKIDLVSMDEAIQRTLDGHEGNRFVAITFDDGYRDNAEIAAPILRKYEAPYTIFVATGLIEGTAWLWWDVLEEIIRRQSGLLVKIAGESVEFDCATADAKTATYNTLLAYLTNDVAEEEQRRWVSELAVLYKVDIEKMRSEEMMTWQEIRELARDPLCTIGAHTIHHYAVARLSEQDALFEMREGARILHAELGEPPKHFAYPYGYPSAAGKRDFEIAGKLDFDSAVTTRPGVIYPGHKHHMTALPRISLNGHFQATRYTKTLLCGLPTLLANKGRKLNVG
jgi:peptidoglycan/xylan/chitin deacetylase (PgdA/CDA1 family)